MQREIVSRGFVRELALPDYQAARVGLLHPLKRKGSGGFHRFFNLVRIFATRHGHLWPASTGSSDDRRNGFHPIPGTYFVYQRIADGSNKINLWWKQIALFVRFSNCGC